MIKKLRQKFVFTTMLILVFTFGILFTIDSFMEKYWNEQETIDLLEWYSSSDSFFESNLNDIEQSDETINPIFFYSLTSSLDIKEVLVSSKRQTKAPDKEVIQSIFEQSQDLHKWKSYIYVINETTDGYQLTLTNMSEGKAGIYRHLGTAFLMLLGFSFLLVISFFLSRFVTQPAKSALEREKQFISDASHELKTPLAAMLINAQAALSDDSDNKNLQYILSETKRMDLLIQKLLKLSYIDENEENLEKKNFSLSSAVEEMILTMESTIYEKNIHLEYNIEDHITYLGSEPELKQVLAILLDNAIKHTPESGTIIYSLVKKNHHPIVTVTNTGSGIPEDVIPHLFERFYRVDSSRKGNNYGLGLAIAKTIIEAHNASIQVTSELGKSTTFTVTL